MAYFKKIVGERLYLSPMDPADAPQYAVWINDPDVAGYLDSIVQNFGIKAEQEWIENNASEPIFAVVLFENDRLIGNVGLMDVDRVNRTAEIGIFIGEAPLRGKGFGSEAMALLLGYSFDILNLENILLRVYGYNARARRVYENLGFREIGRRRDALRRFGATHDVIYMDLTVDDFRKGEWRRFAVAPPEGSSR